MHGREFAVSTHEVRWIGILLLFREDTWVDIFTVHKLQEVLMTVAEISVVCYRGGKYLLNKKGISNSVQWALMPSN